MARSFFSVFTLILLLCSGVLCSGAHAGVPGVQPSWSELTQQQRQILAPLAADWEKLDNPRRKKWLSIAERYPSMKPDEQQRVQRRMKGWASLTPEQRSLARKKYIELKKAPPEKRAAIRQKLEEYEQLPADEKHRLQQQAPKKPQPRTHAQKSRPLPIRPGSNTAKPLSAPINPVPALPKQSQ